MRARELLGGTDLTAGLALLIYPIVYTGVLLREAIVAQGPPQLDPAGQPYPTNGDFVGYIVVGAMFALLGHLIVFVPFRARHRSWPLLALVGLQLLAAAGSLVTFELVNPLIAVLVAPALVTFGVYGLAVLIVRRNQTSERSFFTTEDTEDTGQL